MYIAKNTEGSESSDIALLAIQRDQKIQTLIDNKC